MGSNRLNDLLEQQSLACARDNRISYFAGHEFTGLTNTDTLKFAFLVKPNETMYIHFSTLHFESLLKNSIYKITSFNGELASITGGTTPDTNVNEILGTQDDRVTIDINETATFTVPFNQFIAKAIEITQGASTFIDFSIEESSQRDLNTQPIILNNLTNSNKYILFEGQVGDLKTGGSDFATTVTAGVFYSIHNRQD